MSQDTIAQMSQAMTAQIWPKLQAEFGPKVDQATLAELRTEFENALSRFVNDAMKDAPAIYARYFTAQELHDLTGFYQTPTGQKALRTMPKVMADSFGAMLPKMENFQKEVQAAMAGRSEEARLSAIGFNSLLRRSPPAVRHTIFSDLRHWSAVIRRNSMTLALAIPPKTPARAFLGVEQSASGRAWRDRLDERASARALAMAQRHDLPELLARVLAGRGVEAEEAPAFLDPTVRALMPDPSVLAGMPAAAARLADAVGRGESVAIFGDYDVDGATAAATLARYLRQCGIEPIIHIPDRLVRGLRAERRGGARARRARRDAAGHGRLRHHQPRAARRSAPAWAWTRSSSTTTSPTRRCRRRSPSSIPTGRTTSPGSAISPPSGSCS